MLALALAVPAAASAKGFETISGGPYKLQRHGIGAAAAKRIGKMQAVYPHAGIDTVLRDVNRPTSSVAGSPALAPMASKRSKRYPWSTSPEDLYYQSYTNEVISITEKQGERTVFGVRASRYGL